MSSKSWLTFTTPRAVGVRKYLDRHTEPWFLRIEDRTSDGRIKSSKRKDCATERLEKASKRSKDSKSPTPGLSHLVLEKSAFRKKSSKRKSSSDGTKQPRSKKSKTSSSQEEASCSVFEADTPLPSTYKSHSIEDFEEKYKEQDKLGEGGFGTVFFGKRREDNFPVVIKHVAHVLVSYLPVLLNGKMTKIPKEVALLIKVGAGPEATSSNVTPILIDWYDLEDELIMVFERPKENIDLEAYLANRRTFVHEREVKVIMRQLVHAAAEMQSKGVFHRDIKPDNIVCDTSPDHPAFQCVRFIDFGIGVTFTPEAITRRNGTKSPAPNWQDFNATTADCVTVLQLGTVMDWLVRHIIPDDNNTSEMRTDISEDCKCFLLGCYCQSHEDRLTLEEVQNHPWLK
ncbi:unnamed protein product [Oreochromis niloticus]|nr:unnamed protein product [Mustela putorius furo]